MRQPTSVSCVGIWKIPMKKHCLHPLFTYCLFHTQAKFWSTRCSKSLSFLVRMSVKQLFKGNRSMLQWQPRIELRTFFSLQPKYRTMSKNFLMSIATDLLDEDFRTERKRNLLNITEGFVIKLLILYFFIITSWVI